MVLPTRAPSSKDGEICVWVRSSSLTRVSHGIQAAVRDGLFLTPSRAQRIVSQYNLLYRIATHSCGWGD